MSEVVELSAVITLYNEEVTLFPLYDELSSVLNALGRSYEVIIVDDGSQDNSFENLRPDHEPDSRWKAIRFCRNYGQTAGLSAGFEAAECEVVITLDADLQNDPRDIPKLLARLDEGYNIVSGRRKHRKDTIHPCTADEGD